MSTPHEGETTPDPPVFDPDSPHQQRPRLRPVRGFSAKNGEQLMLGLADAHQISDQVVFTIPQAQEILPHFDGQNDLDQVVEKVGKGLRRQDLEMLVAQLDHAGLLEGPRFEEMWSKVRSDYDSLSHLPPASTAQFADAVVAQALAPEVPSDSQKREQGPGKMRELFDQWIDAALKDAENPSFDRLPRAVVVPHLDYPRGWMNYATVYGRMRVADRPDRVLILGTNHFGRCSGICACDKGYETPLGICPFDETLSGEIQRRLPEPDQQRIFEHKYDHEREHSIELQVPWIQHVFGADDSGCYPSVLGVLIHDPTVKNGESYDGAGVDLMAFVDATRTALEAVDGTTLIVSSADLSHVGFSFGDQQSIIGETDEAKAFRQKVFDHDREMIELIREGKAEELVASMAWQQNPTRWCSVGNLVATLKIAGAGQVDVLNYTMATDQQGMMCVSSCAAVIE